MFFLTLWIRDDTLGVTTAADYLSRYSNICPFCFAQGKAEWKEKGSRGEIIGRYLADIIKDNLNANSCLPNFKIRR